MEIGIGGFLNSWGCFGRNPGLATRVMFDEAGVAVANSNPVRHVLELEKSGYLEDTRTLAIWTAMLYSITLGAAYALMSMTYGAFWI